MWPLMLHEAVFQQQRFFALIPLCPVVLWLVQSVVLRDHLVVVQYLQLLIDDPGISLALIPFLSCVLWFRQQ